MYIIVLTLVSCVIASDPHWEHIVIGLWVIGGILSFMVIEKMFMDEEDDEEDETECETVRLFYQ